MVDFFKITISLLALGLASCQNKHLDRCSKMNWESLGVTSAMQGKLSEPTFQKNKNICQKFKTVINKKAFQEGYAKGLTAYCTIQNGVTEGLNGEIYKNICPTELKKHFLTGYYKGRLNYLKTSFKKHKTLQVEAEDRLWRKTHEYTLILNEDPQQAKIEKETLDAYQEEVNLLSKKKNFMERELDKIKRLQAESNF